MTKTQENKIKKFIKENKLDFTGTGSDLNSVCCIISGYALHIKITDVDELYEIISKDTHDLYEELDRVFNYADMEGYGAWWNTDEAKKQYKF